MPQISGKIIPNAIFLVSNWTWIFMLLCCQWWVWDSCPLIWNTQFGYMFILHEHYLVGEMDLGQDVQDCTLICTYDQLFEPSNYKQKCCNQSQDSIILSRPIIILRKINRIQSPLWHIVSSHCVSHNRNCKNILAS